MRLIDADENKQWAEDHILDAKERYAIIDFLRNCSTVEAVPVRRGHWKEIIRHEHFPSGKPYTLDYCSVCGKRGSAEYNFCPNCGCDMREAKHV